MLVRPREGTGGQEEPHAAAGEEPRAPAYEAKSCRGLHVTAPLIGECFSPPRFVTTPDCFTYTFYDAESRKEDVCFPGQAIIEVSGPQYLDHYLVVGTESAEGDECGPQVLTLTKVEASQTGTVLAPGIALATLGIGEGGKGRLEFRGLKSQTGTKSIDGALAGAVACSRTIGSP